MNFDLKHASAAILCLGEFMNTQAISYFRFGQLFAMVLLGATFSVFADDEAGGYLIQPGDVLGISVWKEEDLRQEILVRPDGGISFPLTGDLVAAGRTVIELQKEIVGRIDEYIPEPVVTVQVIKIDGNSIFVLGKVNRPGAFVMPRPLDVTQALALAGGLATFAAENDISILRRSGSSQSAIEFRYGDVQRGEMLEQNILLQPGDVVVVP